MSNINQFPKTNLHIVHSLVNRGVKCEDEDQQMAIMFYKEAIKLLLDHSVKRTKEFRSITKINDILWTRLKASNASLKPKDQSSTVSDCKDI